jgi:hypothetical protein
MTMETTRIGRWIVLDVGTHKVYGIPTEFTRSVQLPSEMLDSTENQKEAGLNPSVSRPTSDKCAQPGRLDMTPRRARTVSGYIRGTHHRQSY